MKLKTIVGLVVMAGFAGLLFMNFGSQVGGYMTFEEAASTGAKAHVVGKWVEDRPTRYDRSANVFVFHMRDRDGNVRKVRYANPKPANFEEATQVVVEGQARGDVFAADHILVKCPSKYNDAKGLGGKQASRSGAPNSGSADGAS
jgi:cytochrome c-type biogenesis protein CcmE